MKKSYILIVTVALMCISISVLGFYSDGDEGSPCEHKCCSIDCPKGYISPLTKQPCDYCMIANKGFHCAHEGNFELIKCKKAPEPHEVDCDCESCENPASQ